MSHSIKFLSCKVEPMSHHVWQPVMATVSLVLHRYTTILAKAQSLWFVCIFILSLHVHLRFQGHMFRILQPHITNTSFTPASPSRQSWKEGYYRAAGGIVPPLHVPSRPQPSSSPATMTLLRVSIFLHHIYLQFEMRTLNWVHSKETLPRISTAPPLVLPLQRVLPSAGVIFLDANCHGAISRLSSTTAYMSNVNIVKNTSSMC